jgi:hypothetical protein
MKCNSSRCRRDVQVAELDAVHRPQLTLARKGIGGVKDGE